MRKRSFFATIAFLLNCISISGQTFFREGCVHFDEKMLARSRVHRANILPDPKDNWDPSRIYPVAVILVSFSDCDFSAGDPEVPASLGDISDVNERYRALFNECGFNRGVGPGCVAEYFQKQSGGLFNPRFDIYGPVKVNCKSTGNGNYGEEVFSQATEQLVGSIQFDASIYDWDGDGNAEPFIFIYAGYGANETSTIAKKHIWPNTGNFSVVTAGNTTISTYSASAERWAYNDYSCGIGTICHEYCHTFGLPDIYPTKGNEYSVCDEWDLMDGGNYIDDGWCPPALTAHEKMLLGWLDPEILDGPVSIADLQPIEEGGKAYMITTDSPTEFFLLENRQWVGWDSGTPGHGLLISHVDYDSNAWSNNTVNNLPNHHRYEFVHADNLDYNKWFARGEDKIEGHSNLLSSSPYPFVSDSISNNALTDLSTPPATVYNGETHLLSKPLTCITESDDGLISFRFMLDDPYEIVNAKGIVDVVNYILGHPSEGFTEKKPDLNGDGKINIADIVSIVNLIRQDRQ
jgi:M6 family metalloprotease-like protein